VRLLICHNFAMRLPLWGSLACIAAYKSWPAVKLVVNFSEVGLSSGCRQFSRGIERYSASA